MLTLIVNSKKPIVGAIASAVTYVATAVGLDLDPGAAFAISTAVYAIVVRIAKPIFGHDAETPQVGKDGAVAHTLGGRRH